MKPVLVIFATHYGQSLRIANHIALALRAKDLKPDIVDSTQMSPGFSLDNYSAVILIAPVERGRHQKNIIKFITQSRKHLEQVPTAFISVSLSQAGAEDASATPERRARCARDVAQLIQTFLGETSWRPVRVMPVAGALAYTKYSWLLRLVMKWIAKRSGASTDTSQDHEYTNWIAIGQFVDEFAREIAVSSRSPAAIAVTALPQGTTPEHATAAPTEGVRTVAVPAAEVKKRGQLPIEQPGEKKAAAV